MVIDLLVLQFWSETIRLIYSHYEITEFSHYQYLFDLVAVLLQSGNKKAFTSHFVPETEMMQYRAKMVGFNPSSPNIHIQILQTYLYTFP